MAFSAKEGSEASHMVDGYHSSWNRTGGAAVAGPLCRHGGEGAAGRIPGHGDPARVAVQPGRVLGRPKRCGPSIFDRGWVGVFGGQPVVHRHHDRPGADRVLAGRAVVGVQVADDETAAVEVQHHRRRATLGMDWRPIDPDRDRALRAGDGAVLDPQLGMQRPARQVAEPLPGRVDSVLGG
ncbi:hypothetical protein JPH1_33610 [Mycobacterium avium subsp. hominissuis]|uniref:Uncharacterized protein n=1 Tax=Mycobacterium avium subsp. hominissuis TaxID=439334 RepID=A0AAI8X3I2_MYCAV|nr:hypothetical protein JPH1_33610 [Mycobacterium avium subsp. hominissuis]